MSVAEDSSLTRPYVILILTADALNARTMWEWNGHEKIVLMSFKSPMNYRRDEEDVEMWIVKYVEISKQYGLNGRTSFRNFLKAAAITAGTPGFLIEIVEGGDVGLSWNDAMRKRAMEKNEQLNSGQMN